MNVKEVEDGKVLIICRSGCTTQEILDSLGLQWDALFPDKPAFTLERELRKAFPAADVLAALSDEAMLVAVAASNVAEGVELTKDDRQRLIKAANRFYNAVEMSIGKR